MGFSISGGSNSDGDGVNTASLNYQDIGNTRIQWGIYPGGVIGTITLPQPFANDNYSVQLTADAQISAAPGDGGTRTATTQNKTTSDFGVRTNQTAIAFSWIAIGEKG